MNILRKERHVTTPNQLRSYIEDGKGSVRGKWYPPEVYDDGPEAEAGLQGTYTHRLDLDNGEEHLSFTISPEAVQIPISDRDFVLGAIRVCTRREVS